MTARLVYEFAYEECDECHLVAVRVTSHDCNGWTDYQCEECLYDWTEIDATCEECA